MRNQNITKKNQAGFISAPAFQGKSEAGFTLIELLVVVAIIGLLASIALIALTSAQQKARDAKRISDMAQMNTALSLYFATFKGYPSGPSGIPSPIVPTVASSLPHDPQPDDGGCGFINYPAPATGDGSQYYYYASGTPYLGSDNVTLVYPDYGYYFCLGNQTGDLPAGLHVSSPEGLK